MVSTTFQSGKRHIQTAERKWNWLKFDNKWQMKYCPIHNCMNNFSHGIDRLLWGFIVRGATILIVLVPSLEQGFFLSGTVNPQIGVFGVKCFGITSKCFILFKNYTLEKFTANIYVPFRMYQTIMLNLLHYNDGILPNGSSWKILLLHRKIHWGSQTEHDLWIGSFSRQLWKWSLLIPPEILHLIPTY